LAASAQISARRSLQQIRFPDRQSAKVSQSRRV
jgi:hypothetical protein